jgi:hypothetical protein
MAKPNHIRLGILSGHAFLGLTNNYTWHLTKPIFLWFQSLTEFKYIGLAYYHTYLVPKKFKSKKDKRKTIDLSVAFPNL